MFKCRASGLIHDSLSFRNGNKLMVSSAVPSLRKLYTAFIRNATPPVEVTKGSCIFCWSWLRTVAFCPAPGFDSLVQTVESCQHHSSISLLWKMESDGFCFPEIDTVLMYGSVKNRVLIVVFSRDFDIVTNEILLNCECKL